MGQAQTFLSAVAGPRGECPFANCCQESQNSASNQVALLSVKVLIRHLRLSEPLCVSLFLWKRKFADKEKSLKTYCLFASEFLNHSSKTSLGSECGIRDNDLSSRSLSGPPHIPKSKQHRKSHRSN